MTNERKPMQMGICLLEIKFTMTASWVQKALSPITEMGWNQSALDIFLRGCPK